MVNHEGHRQRLRRRFREEGLDHFEPVYALELLLFYCVPRRDTRPIAEALLEHFGSLARVLDAPAEELEQVDGVGQNVSTLLRLVPALSRYYLLDRASAVKILNTTEKCGTYLLNYFHGLSVETVFLLCLDAKCKVLCCKKVAEGSLNSAALSIRRIVEEALWVNATSVILAHNHPGGLALPSSDDVRTTQLVAEALSAVEVCLADHIVVADEDYVSLVQSGYYHPEDYRK